MNIKRALFALIAMMLLPSMAAAQFPEIPPITPADGTANIVVAKIFDDGNFEDEAEITITCDNGSIAPTSAMLGHLESQIFVISNLPEQGPPVSCTVTEGGVSDYEAGYLCAPDPRELPALRDEAQILPKVPDNIIGGDEECANPFELTDTSCSWSDVEADGVGYCIVRNFPEPVDVEVTKVWEMFGAAQDDVNTNVRIRLFCDARIVGGTYIGDGIWRDRVRLREEDGDYDDEDGDYIGEGVAKFEVIPDWYPTSEDPDDQEYTECWATENVRDSAVEQESTCGDEDAPGMEVAAGMGDSCTITNTVFFEGIPTLSQYGMAIMALLMLGVGFVGMRRFV